MRFLRRMSQPSRPGWEGGDRAASAGSPSKAPGPALASPQRSDPKTLGLWEGEEGCVWKGCAEVIRFASKELLREGLEPTCSFGVAGGVFCWRWCPVPALPLAFGAPRRTPWGMAALISSSSSASEWPCNLALPGSRGASLCFSVKWERHFLPSWGSAGSSELRGSESQCSCPCEGRAIFPGNQAPGGKGNCAASPDPKHAAVSLLSSERNWHQTSC